MEIIETYIQPELLVLVPVLYLIGAAIKKSATQDKYIPLILGGISIALSFVYILATSPLGTWQAVITAIFTAIVQGILIAGTSVYGNQVYKQLTSNTVSDKEGV